MNGIVKLRKVMFTASVCFSLNSWQAANYSTPHELNHRSTLCHGYAASLPGCKCQFFCNGYFMIITMYSHAFYELWLACLLWIMTQFRSNEVHKIMDARIKADYPVEAVEEVDHSFFLINKLLVSFIWFSSYDDYVCSKQMTRVALTCTEFRDDCRPDMTDVLGALKQLLSSGTPSVETEWDGMISIMQWMKVIHFITLPVLSINQMQFCWLWNDLR